MNNFYKEFRKLLDEGNRGKCLEFIMKELNNDKINIEDLYLKVLKPSLKTDMCSVNDHICIWKERVRSSIVRTIVECCYPYVIKYKESRFKKKDGVDVVVICPDGEYNEIEARMTSDLVEINGFNALFVGSNTPKEEFLNVMNIVKPGYIVISVTNYYNIFSAKRAINEIRSKSNYDVKIIVGGSAFNNKDTYKDIGADTYMENEFDLRNKFIN